MKITAVICEYNPFHNGHLYHLGRARRETSPDGVVCVMSGNYTQRGDIAVCDKFTRAEFAVKGGADLVIELPFYYAVNCAETFAKGAVKTLSVFDDVTLSFGSECGDVETITAAANAVGNETDEIKAAIKSRLKLGASYPSALSFSLPEKLRRIISSPNNTLATEYVKAARGYGFRFHTIKRENDYNGKALSGSLSSAAAIRETLKNGGNINPSVPVYVAEKLTAPVFNERLSDVALHALNRLKADGIGRLYDVGEGLENRIYEAARTATGYDELLSAIKSKRYTMAKIKRILLYALFGLTKEKAREFFNLPPVVRVLAAGKKGSDIIKYMASKTSDIIVKSSDAARLDETVRRAVEFENNADDLYRILSDSAVKTPFNCRFLN